MSKFIEIYVIQDLARKEWKCQCFLCLASRQGCSFFLCNFHFQLNGTCHGILNNKDKSSILLPLSPQDPSSLYPEMVKTASGFVKREKFAN